MTICCHLTTAMLKVSLGSSYSSILYLLTFCPAFCRFIVDLQYHLQGYFLFLIVCRGERRLAGEATSKDDTKLSLWKSFKQLGLQRELECTVQTKKLVIIQCIIKLFDCFFKVLSHIKPHQGCILNIANWIKWRIKDINMPSCSYGKDHKIPSFVSVFCLCLTWEKEIGHLPALRFKNRTIYSQAIV